MELKDGWTWADLKEDIEGTPIKIKVDILGEIDITLRTSTGEEKEIAIRYNGNNEREPLVRVPCKYWS